IPCCAFFFSSRRRHTISKRDWSTDVCSSDLYRFNAFTITLPGLRERMEDLPVLAYHFLRKAEAKVNKKVERISTDALDLLKRYRSEERRVGKEWRTWLSRGR